MTTYPHMAIYFAKAAAIIVVVLVLFFGFDHKTSSQNKNNQDGPVSVKYEEFFQSGELKIVTYGRLLGEGSPTGQNTYTFNWKDSYIGTHSIHVIAIDGSGIPTRSTPVTFKIDKPARKGN